MGSKMTRLTQSWKLVYEYQLNEATLKENGKETKDWLQNKMEVWKPDCELIFFNAFILSFIFFFFSGFQLQLFFYLCQFLFSVPFQADVVLILYWSGLTEAMKLSSKNVFCDSKFVI